MNDVVNIFVVYDKKAEFCVMNFNSSNVDTAKRELSFMINKGDPGSLISSYPEDYCLFHLGSLTMSLNPFNLENPLSSFKSPSLICYLDELVEKKENN